MIVATTKSMQAKLQQVFSYAQFREDQEAIIQNVLARKHTFVIMPTGGGKSLCYQIPALMQEGVAIVISPLIALMKNQVDKLHAVGVHATFVNSTLSKKSIDQIKTDVLSGKIKLLYIAPESLLKEENRSFLSQARISFVAIDEAHCISDWGHDFRPEYRKIRSIIDQTFGTLPIIGLTATATPKVQQDIIKNLSIEDATIFKSSFDRKNLYYEVISSQQLNKTLIGFIQQHGKSSGIVYCQNRKTVEEMANLLNLNGIRAAPYHAGLESKTRMQNQDAFLNRTVEVIVATIAFGMGIDKPDVRFVVHYNVPRSLESYYQETGRAGRDGLPSTCLMFYSDDHILRMERLNKGKPTSERENAQAMLQAMQGYALSGICRRKYLLDYFGERYQGNCDKCDNCKNPTETYAGEHFIKMLLTGVQQVQEQFGANHIIRILRGVEDDPYIKTHQHQALAVFGKGREQDSAFWQSLISQTLLLGLLKLNNVHQNYLEMTAAGREFLMQSYAITLHKNNNYVVDDANSRLTTRAEAYDPTLLENIQQLRGEIAHEKGIPRYAVFQDTALKDMALIYPTTLEKLAQMGGVGMNKAKKFGLPFIRLIQDYVKHHNITTVANVMVKSTANKSTDKIYIIQQIDRKIDLEEIAAAKSWEMDTLLKAMEQLCCAGTKLNIDYYLDKVLSETQQATLYDYFMHAETDSIDEVGEALQSEFDASEIRMVRIKFLSEVAN